MISYETEDFVDDYDDCEVHEDYFEIVEKQTRIINKCLKNYFSDKVMHDGKEIEESTLKLPYYIDLMFKTSMSDGVQKAYDVMQDNNFLVSNQSDDSIGEDIKYMVDLLKKIRMHVPQEFVGGAILIHLELIEGFEIC